MRRSNVQQGQRQAIEKDHAMSELREEVQRRVDRDRALDTALRSEERSNERRLLRQFAAVQQEVDKQAALTRYLYSFTNHFLGFYILFPQMD